MGMKNERGVSNAEETDEVIKVKHVGGMDNSDLKQDIWEAHEHTQEQEMEALREDVRLLTSSLKECREKVAVLDHELILTQNELKLMPARQDIHEMHSALQQEVANLMEIERHDSAQNSEIALKICQQLNNEMKILQESQEKLIHSSDNAISDMFEHLTKLTEPTLDILKTLGQVKVMIEQTDSTQPLTQGHPVIPPLRRMPSQQGASMDQCTSNHSFVPRAPSLDASQHSCVPRVPSLDASLFSHPPPQARTTHTGPVLLPNSSRTIRSISPPLPAQTPRQAECQSILSARSSSEQYSPRKNLDAYSARHAFSAYPHSAGYKHPKRFTAGGSDSQPRSHEIGTASSTANNYLLPL